MKTILRPLVVLGFLSLARINAAYDIIRRERKLA